MTKILTSYDARGRVEEATQKDASKTLDSVAFQYDNWGNISQMVQDPVDRDAFTTTWEWAKNTTGGGWQNMVLDHSDQPWPDLSRVTPKYTTGTLEEAVGRASYVNDPNGSVLADYWYMGASTVVKTDQPGTNMSSKLDDGSGSSSQWRYLDNFGRVVKNVWQKDLSGSVKPKPVEFDVTYDRYGQHLTVKDTPMGTGTGSTTRNWDDVQVFDDLRRLLSRNSGQMTGGSIATPSHAELYTRNLAGKITRDKVDLDGTTGSGQFSDVAPGDADGGQMDDSRDYNTFNELLTRSVVNYDQTGGRSVALLYDANGNLLHDGEKYAYEYNPWCQLVAIYNYDVSATTNYYRGDKIAQYTYNALGQRTSEQTDNNREDNDGKPDGVLDSFDPIYYIATDLQGRRVATYRGTDTYPKEVFFHHAASVRGPGFAGGPIRRDRKKDLGYDPTTWVTVAAPSTRDNTHYYVSDFRGNVVLLLGDGGSIEEQYRYSPSGVPFGIPRGDVNGDGKCEGVNKTGNDWVQIDGLKTGYHVRADLNLDGVVDGADLTMVENWDGGQLGRAKQTLSIVDNKIGLTCAEYSEYKLLYRARSFVDSVTDSTLLASACTIFWLDPLPSRSWTPQPTCASGTGYQDPSSTNPCDILCTSICNDAGSSIWGQTVCNGQTPLSCVCSRNITGGLPNAPKCFTDQVRACTRIHENWHASHLDCSWNTPDCVEPLTPTSRDNPCLHLSEELAAMLFDQTCIASIDCSSSSGGCRGGLSFSRGRDEVAECNAYKSRMLSRLSNNIEEQMRMIARCESMRGRQ